MLYISRQLTRNNYMVMDTDDGVEEVATASELLEYVKSGLDIKGVVYNKLKTGQQFYIKVYTEATSSSSKLKFMYGINMTGNGDILKSFNGNNKDLVKSCTIRVSDYFTIVDNFSFGRFYAKDTSTKVKIIFDDKITISPKAFNSFYSNCAILDFTEYSDDKIVAKCYAAIFGSNSSVYNFDYYKRKIIDKPFRFELNTMLHMLSNASPLNTPQLSSRALEFLDYSNEVNKALLKILMKEFKSLGTTKEFFWAESLVSGSLRVNNTSQNEIGVSQTKRMLGIKKFSHLDLDSDYILNDSAMIAYGRCIGKVTTINSKSIKRLVNYIYYFKQDCSDEVKSYYINLVRRFIDWVVSEEVKYLC